MAGTLEPRGELHRELLMRAGIPEARAITEEIRDLLGMRENFDLKCLYIKDYDNVEYIVDLDPENDPESQVMGDILLRRALFQTLWEVCPSPWQYFTRAELEHALVNQDGCHEIKEISATEALGYLDVSVEKGVSDDG